MPWDAIVDEVTLWSSVLAIAIGAFNIWLTLPRGNLRLRRLNYVAWVSFILPAILFAFDRLDIMGFVTAETYSLLRRGIGRPLICLWGITFALWLWRRD